MLDAGAGKDRLSYRTLKVLDELEPAIEAVTGFSRYAIDGEPEAGTARISLVDKGGLARDVPSRVERNPELLGTKRRVALDREVMVAQGRVDGRTVILVPEVKANQTTGITLLHVAVRAIISLRTWPGPCCRATATATTSWSTG